VPALLTVARPVRNLDLLEGTVFLARLANVLTDTGRKGSPVGEWD